MSNQEQIDYWNGEAGERWAQEDDRMARLLRPVAEALLDHINPEPGTRAIDIGCGGGSQSILLAERLGGTGHVLGVDISGPLLAVAREKTQAQFPEYAALEFLQADASEHAFEPASVDLLFSRFGVMFFDDPTAAFSNLRTALRPGGRLGFSCWQSVKENQWVREPLQAALQHVPPPEKPDPNAPGPFAFADDSRVTAILSGSGFTDIRLEPREVDMVFGNGGSLTQTVTELVGIGPVSRLLMDADEPTRAQVVDAVTGVMAPYFRDGALQMKGAVWFVTASAA